MLRIPQNRNCVTSFLPVILILLSLHAPTRLSAQSRDTLNHIRYFDSLLVYVVDTLMDKAMWDSAQQILFHAETYATEHLSLHHLSRGEICYRLGQVYYQTHQYAKSAAYHQQELEIKKRHYGFLHIETGKTLTNLGNAYWGMSDYQAAYDVYANARAIFTNTLGEDHLWVGWAWHNLGAMALYTGRIEVARDYLQKALQIKIQHQGDQSEDVARTLNFLGYTLGLLGDQETSEAYTLKATRISMDYHGPDRLEYYLYQNNLTLLHMNRGEEDLALQAARSAIAGKTRFLGPRHHDVGNSWNWLGNAFQWFGKYDSARVAFLKALDIYQENALNNKQGEAFALHNLGENAMSLGLYDESASYLRQSLRFKSDMIGTSNPDYVSTQVLYAGALIRIGRPDTALHLLQEARTFFETHQLLHHDGYSLCLSHLVYIHASKGQEQEVMRLLAVWQELQKEKVLRYTRFSSERELTYIAQSAQHLLDLKLSSWHRQHHHSDSLAGEVWNDLAFYHGYVLRTTRQIRNVALRDSVHHDTYAAMDATRSLLYQEWLKPVTDRSGVAALQAKLDSMEKKILVSSKAYTSLQPLPDWKSLQQYLSPKEAVIQFLHYTLYHPDKTDSVYYGAMILTHDHPFPVYVALFEEQRLGVRRLQEGGGDSLVYSFMSGMTFPDLGYLYTLIWKPILPELADVDRIYIVPSGRLHRIPLSVLCQDWVTCIADQKEVIQLQLAQDVMNHRPTSPDCDHMVAFGSLQYDMRHVSDMEAPELQPSEAFPKRKTQLNEGSENIIPANRGSINGWKRIPGSGKEIHAIATIARSIHCAIELVEDTFGTEKRFKSIGHWKSEVGPPMCLHLATHGYFFPGGTDLHRAADQAKGLVYAQSDHPMIRSGLIMAGANYAWKHGHPIHPNEEDGILTAYEICQQDLSETELVVLSACETALGDIQGHEGVYGLQRAFKIAGVKKLLMSLWKVPDAATAELMISFYTHWLIDKKTIRQSLQSAQRELRDQGLDPYYWAGFVLVE